MNQLTSYPSVIVRQRKELAELFGFETRNKYEILDPNGNLIFYCAETQKGIIGFLWRQLLGHWRSFELRFFDAERNPTWIARHPFRFIFSQLDIILYDGTPIGKASWLWGVLRKRFAITAFDSQRTLKIESGLFSFWTFPITSNGEAVGKIQKKWSGALKEIFTDADIFLVEFSESMTEPERQVVLSTAILVDLVYFERKAGKS